LSLACNQDTGAARGRAAIRSNGDLRHGVPSSVTRAADRLVAIGHLPFICANRRVANGFTEEAAIPTGLKPASWAYAESFIAEDEVLADARQRAADLNATPIGAGGGAALRFLASALAARNVVEIGTGCGVSGVWLMRGMSNDGVLTSVDVEPDHQRLAREAFTAAGFPPQRVRLIPGAALDVLPRLTEGHYDLVFVDGAKQEYLAYFEEARRLLRPGGVVAFDNALWHDKVADSSVRDVDTTALRETLDAVRADEGFVSVLLPVGDGLLAARKQG
jgi:predicted O-methyltransferase YrrM